MNNYDLSDVQPEKPQGNVISPYLTYGSGQVLKISGIELKKSQNTGSSKPIFHMETKPITDPAFVPIDGAKGKVGKVACGVYMNSDALKREFLQKLKTIAVAVGVESEVNKIKSEDFEEVVQRITDVIKGKYARYTLVAGEYPKNDGKVGITLSLPKFKFVESENADPSTIVVFDKENQYHYKKISSTGVTGSGYENYPTSHSSGVGAQASYGTWSSSNEPVEDDPATSDLPF